MWFLLYYIIMCILFEADRVCFTFCCKGNLPTLNVRILQVCVQLEFLLHKLIVYGIFFVFELISWVWDCCVKCDSFFFQLKMKAKRLMKGDIKYCVMCAYVALFRNIDGFINSVTHLLFYCVANFKEHAKACCTCF